MEGNGQWKRWAGGAFMIDQVECLLVVYNIFEGIYSAGGCTNQYQDVGETINSMGK